LVILAGALVIELVAGRTPTGSQQANHGRSPTPKRLRTPS